MHNRTIVSAKPSWTTELRHFLTKQSKGKIKERKNMRLAIQKMFISQICSIARIQCQITRSIKKYHVTYWMLYVSLELFYYLRMLLLFPRNDAPSGVILYTQNIWWALINKTTQFVNRKIISFSLMFNIWVLIN